MSTNKDITLYLDNRNPPPVMNVSQGDTDWLYRFTVMYNNAVYSPSVTYVILTGHKPDGHVFAYRGAKSGNLYTVTPANANGNLVQMTAVAGDVPCELRLISGGRSVGTANFILHVEPGPEGVVTVASASALPAYTTILQELGVLIGKVETLPDDVPGWIGDWLEEHISGGQGVAVDNTLTVQGAAADAKATGDRIKALEDATIETDTSLTVAGAAADAEAVGKILGLGSYDIGDPANWERKTILSGQKSDSTTRITLKSWLPSDTTTVTVASPYQGLIYRYKANGDYVGFWDGSSWVTLGTAAWANSISVPQDAGFVHTIVVRSSDNSTITTAAAVNVSSDSQSSSDGILQDIAKLKTAAAYVAEDPLESGAMAVDTGASGAAYSAFWAYARSAHMIAVGSDPVDIQIDARDLPLIHTVSAYTYGVLDDAVSFLGRVALTLDSAGKCTFAPTIGVRYIRLGAALTEENHGIFHNVSYRSTVPLEVVKCPDIRSQTYGNVTCSYRVGAANFTIGQLLLPPNYSVDGEKVPLYVQVHGTGAMSKWTDIMGVNGSIDSRYLSQYMANEGFAVFDCYPWTSKYYSEDRQISPYNIEIHRRAYIDGIRYICDRYNIDIDRVCLSFKSLGGHLGHWFMVQDELPVTALAMLAPSTGFASTIWSNYFLEKNARARLVEELGLSGETNASKFINTDAGMKDPDCVKFVEDHLTAFAKLIPAAIGTHGATYQQHYTRMVTGVTELPQWMADLGIPAWPEAWQTGQNAFGVPDVVNHPELTKYSLYPVKFWHAFDDINTSGHVDYAIYTWLLNGGSDVEWRTLPWGTGGHHALDTDPNAEKVSGTTRLGIAYTGIAKSYVEMADYFYEKMC